MRTYTHTHRHNSIRRDFGRGPLAGTVELLFSTRPYLFPSGALPLPPPLLLLSTFVRTCIDVCVCVWESVCWGFNNSCKVRKGKRYESALLVGFSFFFPLFLYLLSFFTFFFCFCYTFSKIFNVEESPSVPRFF